ncbi:hypothetical protein AVEN_152055-1 [Araneus ventricosus]|uniref:Reverse transcriptase domain-containing protein n=1 Tax=Araneus ventricosus TaxID=182803 RepID=A0A4Y2NBR9_ARAVE|nr:hypothetical protein AVEN_152055-1 [Araneus ventricosus]
MVASVLADRQVSMEYGALKVTRSYSIGCPQGSNSGPLLWLLVANDALNISLPEDTKVLAYADDIYLFASATGKHVVRGKVHQALQVLDDWSKSAKVEFAHERTKLIPFWKKGRLQHPPYCSFAGNSIKLTRALKMLGVIIDDRLNGLAHLNYIRGKVARIMNRLTSARGRRGLLGKVLKVLYKRALERLVTHAAPAWWARNRTTNRDNYKNPETGPTKDLRGFSHDLHCGTSSFLRPGANSPRLRDGSSNLSSETSFATCFPLRGDLQRTTAGNVPEAMDSSQHHSQSAVGQRLSPFSIFTDRSKIDGRVGAAFHVIEGNNTVDFQYRLEDYNCVYQAELSALQQALRWKQAE